MLYKPMRSVLLCHKHGDTHATRLHHSQDQTPKQPELCNTERKSMRARKRTLSRRAVCASGQAKTPAQRNTLRAVFYAQAYSERAA